MDGSTYYLAIACTPRSSGKKRRNKTKQNQKVHIVWNSKRVNVLNREINNLLMHCQKFKWHIWIRLRIFLLLNDTDSAYSFPQIVRGSYSEGSFLSSRDRGISLPQQNVNKNACLLQLSSLLQEVKKPIKSRSCVKCLLKAKCISL